MKKIKNDKKALIVLAGNQDLEEKEECMAL